MQLRSRNCWQRQSVFTAKNRRQAKNVLSAGLPGDMRCTSLHINCPSNVVSPSKAGPDHEQHILLRGFYRGVLEIEVISNENRATWDFLQLPSLLAKLPSVAFLSLCEYAFASFSKRLQSLNASQLQILVLDKCKRLDLLFRASLMEDVNLKQLTISSPVWREGDISRHSQQQYLIKFINGQKDLEKLELISLGIFHFCLAGKRRLATLVLRDLRHQLRTTTPHSSFGRAIAFRSCGSSDLRRILLVNCMIEDLQIDIDVCNSGQVRADDRISKLEHCMSD